MVGQGALEGQDGERGRVGAFRGRVRESTRLTAGKERNLLGLYVNRKTVAFESGDQRPRETGTCGTGLGE